MITPNDKALAEALAAEIAEEHGSPNCQFLTLPEAMARIAELEWQLLEAGLVKLAHVKLHKGLVETLEIAIVKLLETPGNDALKADLKARVAIMMAEATALLALQQKAGSE